MRGILRAAMVRMVACAAAIVPAVLALATPAGAATQYRFAGHGWGHGIGMSQYGAQGFAQHGYSASQIIRYYFQGVTVGAAPAGTGVNEDVLLSAGRAAASFQVDRAGATVVHGGTSYPTQVGDLVVAKVEGGRVSVYRSRGGTSTKLFGGTAALVTLAGGDGAFQTMFTADSGAYGHHYRGDMRIHLVGSRISVVNHVRLEKYLYGVVPAEMPASWRPAALGAQAIAARSYAIATTKSGIYDAFCDTRSQVYRGMEAEAAATTTAINSTAGVVAKVDGAVIPAFFHSTSGGRTAAIEDAWGGSPRSYLKSVPDPYEASPYTTWPEHLAYSPSTLAGKLSGYVSGSLRGITLDTNPSRRVDTVTIVGSTGNTTIAGSTFQYRLGLRSTWFRVEKLSIFASDYSVAAGARVTLSGVAPASGSTYLYYRNAGAGSWTLAGRVYPDSHRAWRRTVTVPQGRTYRLKRSGYLGPGVTIAIG